MKTVNIDEFLNTNAITLTIGEKDYTIKDLPFETQQILNSASELLNKGDSKQLRKGIATIVGCKESDLEDYGIKGLTYILEVVTRHFFPEASSQENPSDS